MRNIGSVDRIEKNNLKEITSSIRIGGRLRQHHCLCRILEGQNDRISSACGIVSIFIESSVPRLPEGLSDPL